jgi:hypothetical protein
MSQEINLRGDSDDNGEWPNTAPVPSLPLSRKRPRDKEESSKVEVSPHNKERRGVVKIERNVKNDAAGECVLILKGDHVIEEDASSEDGEIAEHHESHEGIAAAASHPINLDSEQTCRGYGSANKHSQRLSTFEPPSNASGQQGSAAWEDRLGALANYRNIHGHCNVPPKHGENTKLGNWVASQRDAYRLHLEGKRSPMTPFRFQELESLGFEWGLCITAWEDRLSELADYHKVHGHCNVPKSYSGNTKLAKWVRTQRKEYRLHLEGKTSPMTPFRIQKLESLGFHWDSSGSTWQERLSELADYRKIFGHCNVPQNYRENIKLANWVATQRDQYMKHLEGKTSPTTPFRIQELESLGFEWRVSSRKNHLSELADYHKIHGHCNVSQYDSENTELANWVATQRLSYRLHLEGKSSPMTTFRIKALEGLGFRWDSRATTWTYRLSELADYRKIHGHCNVPHDYSENTKLANWVATQRDTYRLHMAGKTSSMTPLQIQQLNTLGFKWDSRGAACWNDHLSELADYHKIHGHCNVPQNHSELSKLANWVATQRGAHRSHLEGKKTTMTPFRIQELESLGFEWDSHGSNWEDRVSELAGYRKIHGTCNVSKRYSGNTELINWVSNQRKEYKRHREGKISFMTPFRIQELERLGFEWDSLKWDSHGSWEERLCELADYRKIQGHCNVSHEKSIENPKLAHWVGTQRKQYKLHLEEKTSPMTLPRIQALESLGFEWKPYNSHKKGTPKNLSLDDDATRVRVKAVEAPEQQMQTIAQTPEGFICREIHRKQVDVAFDPEESDWNGEVSLAYIPCETAEI